jgi:hypothetical protein
MKTLIAVAVVAAFAVAVRAAAPKAPVAAADVPLKSIGETHNTEVLYFRHEGHDCYIVNARNAAGVSLQCPR